MNVAIKMQVMMVFLLFYNCISCKASQTEVGLFNFGHLSILTDLFM